MGKQNEKKENVKRINAYVFRSKVNISYTHLSVESTGKKKYIPRGMRGPNFPRIHRSLSL